MSAYQQLLLDKPALTHHPKSDIILRLLNVSREEAMSGELRILDEKDNLILVHYVNAIPSVRHIRGSIIDVDKEKLIVQSFPFPEEFEINEIENFNSNIFDGNHYFSIGKEGTIIRLFYYNGEWQLSTHRRIDGKKSRWAGPSFGSIFNEVWNPENYNLLNKDYVYILLIQHPENRIVCRISKPSVVFVGVFIPKYSDTPNNQESGVISFSEKDNIERYFLDKITDVDFITRLNITSKQELESIVSNLDYNDTTGIIVHTKCQDKIISMKFNPPGYSIARDIRGNEPNLRLRFLQLRDDGNEDDLVNLFPEKKLFFDGIINDINHKLPYFLKKLFLKRKIEFAEGANPMNMTQYPKEVHIFLEGVRKNFDKNFTIIQNIKNRLDKTEGKYINAMLRHMRKS